MSLSDIDKIWKQVVGECQSPLQVILNKLAQECTTLLPDPLANLAELSLEKKQFLLALHQHYGWPSGAGRKRTREDSSATAAAAAPPRKRRKRRLRHKEETSSEEDDDGDDDEDDNDGKEEPPQDIPVINLLSDDDSAPPPKQVFSKAHNREFAVGDFVFIKLKSWKKENVRTKPLARIDDFVEKKGTDTVVYVTWCYAFADIELEEIEEIWEHVDPTFCPGDYCWSDLQQHGGGYLLTLDNILHEPVDWTRTRMSAALVKCPQGGGSGGDAKTYKLVRHVSAAMKDPVVGAASKDNVNFDERIQMLRQCLEVAHDYKQLSQRELWCEWIAKLCDYMPTMLHFIEFQKKKWVMSPDLIQQRRLLMNQGTTAPKAKCAFCTKYVGCAFKVFNLPPAAAAANKDKVCWHCHQKLLRIADLTEALDLAATLYKAVETKTVERYVVLHNKLQDLDAIAYLRRKRGEE